MAISAIGVSLKNNYNVSFESKKKNENSYNKEYASSSLKAVPLAVLLAMSPMNNLDAKYYNDSEFLPDVENVSKVNNTKGRGTPIEVHVFNDKIAQGKVKEVVRFMDLDGDSSTAEKAELDIYRHDYTHYIRNPKIIAVKLGASSPEYYAYGSGFKRKYSSGLVFDKEHILQKIGSEEVIEFLKDFKSDKARNNGAISDEFIVVTDYKDCKMISSGVFNNLSDELKEKLLR